MEPDLAPSASQQPSPVEVEVAACIEAMPRLVRHIDEVREDIDGSVREVCDGFQGIATRANESVQLARDSLGGADGEGVLASTEQAFELVLAGMAEGCQHSVHAVERVEDITKAVLRAERILARLQEVSEGTKLLTVNAKVQAAKAGSSARGFIAIADAINDFSCESKVIVDEVRASLEGVTRAVSATRKELDRLSAWAGRREELQSSLLMAKRCHEDTQEHLQLSTCTADELAQEIYRLMQALQFQDRVTQRLEHVKASLTEMISGLSDSRAGRGEGGDIERYRRRLEASYTMAEEHGMAAASGEVELF